MGTMDRLLSLTVVGIASGLWLWYLNRLDMNRPKRDRRILVPIMMLAGGFTVIPTLWANRVDPFAYTEWVAPFLQGFLVVGMAEEATKFLMFILVTRLTQSIREPHDGAIQGAAISVGFATVEDVAYGLLFGPEVAIMRIVLMGVHALAGATWGYLWGVAVHENSLGRDRDAYRIAVIGLIPVAALNSFLVSVWHWTPRSNGGLLWNAVLVGLMLFAVNRGYHNLKRRSPYHQFSYREYDKAIDCIQRGLARRPTSLALKRRLGLYLIAAGKCGSAARLLYSVTNSSSGSGASSTAFFAGVAMVSAGRRRDGEAMIRKVCRRLTTSVRRQLVQELRAITRDARLVSRVSLLVSQPQERTANRDGSTTSRRKAA